MSIIGICSIYAPLISGMLHLHQISTPLSGIQNVSLKKHIAADPRGNIINPMSTKHLTINANCTRYLGAGDFGVAFGVVCAFTGVCYVIKYAQECGD
eukprot:UN07789